MVILFSLFNFSAINGFHSFIDLLQEFCSGTKTSNWTSRGQVMPTQLVQYHNYHACVTTDDNADIF